MLICPMCKKSLSEWTRVCPRCRADLSILVDYVDHLRAGLSRAQEQTRKGELGEAVWAYLEVLDVDPDNADARRQVSRVTAAVRQFDRAATGRKWLDRLRRQARFRSWFSARQQAGRAGLWRGALTVLLIGMIAFLLGYQLGRYEASRERGEQAVAPGTGR